MKAADESYLDERDRPLLSVIIPAKDFGENFLNSVKSVSLLNKILYELLIIVPTQVVFNLDQFKKNLTIQRARIVRDAGVGIYAAMNDGARQARGEYIYFIGVGDLILSRDMTKALDRLRGIDMDLFLSRALMPNAKVYPPATEKYISFVSGKMLCHQGVIMKRSRFNELNGFNIAYDLAADFDLLLRATRGKMRVEISDLVISSYLGGGYTSKKSSVPQIAKSLMFNGLYANGTKFLVREFISKLYRGYQPKRRRLILAINRRIRWAFSGKSAGK
jgi:glycosyltransferase involved in cell wall biosynthesis